jgi:hypothetical protein
VLTRLAGGPKRAILTAAALTFVSCLVINWISPYAPLVPDEFSYLLASDTFAHGRLTNPPHPLWEHFEAFHVNPLPTYQSKYPPGQGLFMAAGQVLTGLPIVGVCLSMAAASAALCWMLLAWVPPRWALFGALLPALRFGSLQQWDEYWFSYWSRTFWGGAVAAMGAALVFGALPRILRSARRGDAAWLALGVIVLANSRPLEGAVAALPVAVALLIWAWTHWRDAWRVAIPMAAVLLTGMLAMAYYNYRGTGDPLKLPYVVNMELYEVAPVFIFQSPKPAKTYNHEPLRAYYFDFMLQGYHEKRSGSGFTPQHWTLMLQFFLGFALYLPVVCAFGRPYHRWAIFAAATIILEILTSAISSFANVLRPHYAAPIAPWFVFLAVTGLRRMRTFRLGSRSFGRPLAECIIAIALLSMVMALGLRLTRDVNYNSISFVRDRPAITKQLEANGHKNLVLVSYGPKHNPHLDWVSNGADLVGAAVLWARDMGREKNARLLEYYSDRKVWRLHVAENKPELTPYREPLNDLSAPASDVPARDVH